MTEAEKRSDVRRDKAAWMNDQLATRLHQNDVQPGVAPAKDARPDGEFPAPKGTRAKPAADKP